MSTDYKTYDELPLAMNAADVAKALGVSVETAYQLIHSKDFPTCRIGKRRYVVPKDRFILWLNKNTGGVS